MSNEVPNDTILELAKIGVIFGHKKSKTHPKMKPFIASNRNEIELLSPEAVLGGIEKSAAFLESIAAKNGIVLMVGTGGPAKAIVQEMAEEFGMPYVISRWLGGTLTNFKVIGARLGYYQSLKLKKEKGELTKYTKKEQLEFDKLISKMTGVFEGLKKLTRLPDAVFIVDIKVHDIAVKEAKKMKIPVIAIVDTNDNPQIPEYPIIANDHSKSSISWVLEKMKEGMRKAKKPEITTEKITTIST